MGTKSKKQDEDDDDEDTPDHGTKNISGALAALDNDGWGDTEEKDFGEVAPGKYQVRIDKISLNHAKSESGRFQCSWTMTVCGGEYKNRKIFKHDGLDNEQSRSFFRGALARLGVEWPGSAKKLPAVLEELMGTYCQVTVKQKDEYTNVYFDKALDSDEVDSDGLEEVDEDEDDDKKKKGKKADVDSDDEDGDTDDEPKKGKSAKSDDSDDDSDEDEEEEPKKKGKKDEDDADEDDEDGEAEEADDDEKADADSECTVKFTDKDLDKDAKKEARSIASVAKFDPDDYNTLSDMLADVAEHYGIGGVFKQSSKLLAEIKKAAAKKKK